MSWGDTFVGMHASIVTFCSITLVRLETSGVSFSRVAGRFEKVGSGGVDIEGSTRGEKENLRFGVESGLMV